MPSKFNLGQKTFYITWKEKIERTLKQSVTKRYVSNKLTAADDFFCLSVFSVLNISCIIIKIIVKYWVTYLSKGYGTTLQLGILSFRNSAATSALGLPTSLGLQKKLYLNYYSWYKSRLST